MLFLLYDRRKGLLKLYLIPYMQSMVLFCSYAYELISISHAYRRKLLFRSGALQH